MRAGRFTGVIGAIFALGLASCAGPNLWTDGTSVSTGKSNRGRLRSPAKLPRRGRGYVVPPRWERRGFVYGVDELVAAIQRAGARVRAQTRMATLGVADISRNRGGNSAWHNSHQSGRDVDFLFFTTDSRKRPLPPPTDDMIAFDGEGRPYVRPRDTKGYIEPAWAERRFDWRRNWELVESLLTDPGVRIQWIFVSEPLKAGLIRYAKRRKRPRWIIDYARVVLRQPGDALPHDNHFHVRIYCSRADRFHGCIDRGPVWQHEKKTFKYRGPERYDPVLWRQVMVTPTRFAL